VAWVYILRCGDNSLYVGSTSDIDERVRAHAEGRGGSHTAARRPVRLVYQEELPTLHDARKREQQIKRWSGRKKSALIAGDRTALKGPALSPTSLRATAAQSLSSARSPRASSRVPRG
jgi:predicted GIY-YIG superfamily endonuclease